MDADEEFRWLFATEYQSVVRTTYLVLHNHARAEEIAQDAFVQLLRHWKKVRGYDSPQAWVRRVALRLAAKDARRERLGELLTRREAKAAASAPVEADPVSDAVLRDAIRRSCSDGHVDRRGPSGPFRSSPSLSPSRSASW